MPVTDNCPTWIRGRGQIDVEISCPNTTKVSAGPGERNWVTSPTYVDYHLSDRASNPDMSDIFLNGFYSYCVKFHFQQIYFKSMNNVGSFGFNISLLLHNKTCSSFIDSTRAYLIHACRSWYIHMLILTDTRTAFCPSCNMHLRYCEECKIRKINCQTVYSQNSRGVYKKWL